LLAVSGTTHFTVAPVLFGGTRGVLAVNFLLSTLWQLLTVLGLVVMTWAGYKVGKVTETIVDPLKMAGLGRGRRSEVRRMIGRRILAYHEPTRQYEFEQAKYDRDTGLHISRWSTVLSLGVIFLPCVLYAVPSASPLTYTFQVAVVLLIIFAWRGSRRRLRNGAQLLREGCFQARDTGASGKP